VSEEFCQDLVLILTQDANLVTAENPVMPGLLANPMPPDQSGLDFAFNWNTLESDTAPDDWMTMDPRGTWW